MTKDKSFKRLQNEWYQRLAQEGFKDIENTQIPGQALLERHTRAFAKASRKTRCLHQREYQLKAEDFFHHPEWREVCVLVIQHGNCNVSVAKASLIWELHLEGRTEREISLTVQQSKTGIHQILERLKAWMHLIS